MANITNFRIETDNSILLYLIDGRVLRVEQADLSKYLNTKEMTDVKQAISTRKKFIKRVLPPGALVLLTAATIGLGAYDVNRLAEIMKPESVPATSQITDQESPPVTVPTNNIQTEAVAQQAPTATAASQSKPTVDRQFDSSRNLKNSPRMNDSSMQQIIQKIRDTSPFKPQH